MKTNDLYRIAFEKIRPVKLRKHGSAGHVACALEAKDGSVFTGVCIDLPCSLGMCAEQAAIAEMLKQGQTKIHRIIAVYEDGSILPPCGRCREFIAQIDEVNINSIIMLPELKEAPLCDLLPERWDVKWS